MSQVVEVSIRPGSQWAYRWTGRTPLKVGDRVAVPARPDRPMHQYIEWVGPVVKLGSDYDGPLRKIIRKEKK